MFLRFVYYIFLALTCRASLLCHTFMQARFAVPGRNQIAWIKQVIILLMALSSNFDGVETLRFRNVHKLTQNYENIIEQ